MAVSQPLPRSSAEAGFSIVEGLIAALILLVVILGVLPLVSQSMMNNLQGNDASMQTSASVDGTETLLSLPFNSDELLVASGTTSTLREDVFTLTSNRWIDKVTFDLDPAGDYAQFTRTATIEQFGANDLDDDETLDTPLDGVTGAGSVHLKRVRMQIVNERTLFDFGDATSGSYEIVAVHTY